MTFELFSPMYEEKQASIEKLILESKDIPGSLAEVGVYRGMNALRMLKAGHPKRIFLFDTFIGIPQKDVGIDVHEIGDFADTDFLQVCELFKGQPAHLIMGFFPDSAWKTREAYESIYSVVHLDGDQYLVTSDGLSFFWPRLSLGGTIVLDDFMWKNCPGVARALFEFLGQKTSLDFTLRTNEYNQAFITKIAND